MTSYRHRIRPHEKSVQLVCKLIDILAIGIGLWVLIVWQPSFDSSASIVTCLLACGLFSIIAEFVGVYRNWQGVAFASESRTTLLALGVTMLALALVGHFSRAVTELSGWSLICWFGLSLLGSLGGRIALRLWLLWRISRGYTRSYAVVGANELGLHLAESIARSPELALKFVGFYDDRPPSRTLNLPPQYSVRLGDTQTLVDDAQRLKIDTVFLALPMRAELRIRELVTALTNSAVSVYVVPDVFAFQLLHSRWTDVQGIPVVSVFENPIYGVDGLLKRMFDLALGTICFLVFALPMCGIAAAIKFGSPGPVFFRQRRYGLDGREFFVWKFRTMTVCEDGPVIQQATAQDRRVTRIGALLRKTSLDELPQLFNVLAGTMSLVGPRPHATAHNELYRKQIHGYMLRHKIKPGITGLAQVHGYRGETETLEKMERRVYYDHQYIREWSIWLDIRILLQTFGVVFSRQNAY